MGFFKNILHSVDPREHFKNPGKALVNSVKLAADPAGGLIRTGRTGENTMTLRSGVDPAGFTDVPPQQVAPNTYQAPHMLQLSPAAQQLYDDMKARAVARTQGAQYQTATRPAAAPPVAAPPPAATPFAAPAMGAPGSAPKSKPQLAPTAMRDGGKVRKPKHGADCHFESKVFNRKPNGKPC